MKQTKRKAPTPIQKARAWEWAAQLLKDSAPCGIGSKAYEHVWNAVIPSLRRRAAIIRRNARKA